MGTVKAISSAWPAPAKINRFLHVTGRRADGYHILQTVFQFLDLTDQLSFELRDDGRIQRARDIPGVPEEQDLTIRAARLLQQYTNCPLGAVIYVDKNLPMGGGLGGGSSDAATVLTALNHLWDTGLDQETLSHLGLQLGADVPIFIHGHSAWAEGVGERITDIDLDEPWFLLVVPNVHVSTAAVFRDGELTRNTPPIKIADFLSGAGHNDCEQLVCARYPAVGEALEWMKQHVDSAPGCKVKSRMTGTGACLFAGFEHEPQAIHVQQTLPQGWVSYVAKGLNVSPLSHRLAKEG